MYYYIYVHIQKQLNKMRFLSPFLTLMYTIYVDSRYIKIKIGKEKHSIFILIKQKFIYPEKYFYIYI